MQQQSTPGPSFIETIAAVFIELGWLRADPDPLAFFLPVSTAVGGKRASVLFSVKHLCSGLSLNAFGSYESEGNNVLSTAFLTLEEPMDAGALRSAIQAFSTKVHQAIDGSYARKLLLLKPNQVAVGRWKAATFGNGPTGLPAIEWWRWGTAALGEPSKVTKVVEYSTTWDREVAFLDNIQPVEEPQAFACI